jgi:hypothetical protein
LTKKNKVILVLALLLCFFNAVDAFFTYWAYVYHSGKELNPFMDALLKISPEMFVVLKLVLMPICAWGFWVFKTFWFLLAAVLVYFLNFAFQMFQLYIMT